MPILGLKTLSLQYPVSTTYITPSSVRLVSAMFVETTHFRAPPSASWKIFAWRSAGSCE